jgi:hypothetical protein
VSARKNIRPRTYADPQVTEAMRDVQEAISAIPALSIVTVRDRYTEPYDLFLDGMPAAILAVRVVDAATPESPIAHGVAVEWVWGRGRARITHVDGLVPGTKYTITFLIIGQAGSA